METLKILSPIACAFIGALIGQPLIYITNLVLRKKLKKIENAIESLKLFENYETQFKTEFILPDLKETYFYIQTGIQTNEKSIEKYTKFKNELSLNYTWKQIKAVNSYLDLSTDIIQLRLSKIEKITGKIALIILLLMIFSIQQIIIYINLDMLKFDLIEIITLSLIMFFFGIILTSFINPIFIVKSMERRLKITRQY